MARIKWAVLAMAAVALGAVPTAKAEDKPDTPGTIVLGHVEASRTNVCSLPLEAGKPAVVALVGDGGTHLKLQVLDEDGRTIGSDVDKGDGAMVMWTPRPTNKKTGLKEATIQVTVKVVNLGAAPNVFLLTLN